MVAQTIKLRMILRLDSPLAHAVQAAVFRMLSKFLEDLCQTSVADSADAGALLHIVDQHMQLVASTRKRVV